MANQSGRPVWNSDNRPMTVDFVPETDIYMSQMGRIGLCMAPGRKKKKAHHEWDRDLDKDLDRIKNAFGCDVFVSLIRHSELVSLKIPNLVEEVERRFVLLFACQGLMTWLTLYPSQGDRVHPLPYQRQVDPELHGSAHWPC
jgi:hypothetical protein